MNGKLSPLLSINFLVAILLSGLFLGCASSAPKQGDESSPAEASAPAKATPLPDVEQARLKAAFAGLEEVLAQWPWATSRDACIHLYSQKTEWLLDCEGHVPTDFVNTAETFAGAPIYSGASPVTYYGTKVPYDALVSAKPATVSFFQPAIAESQIYKERAWYVAATMEALSADHPAFDESMTSEEWLGILIHEFFHLHQLQNPTVDAFLLTNEAEFLQNPGGRLQKTFGESEAYAAAVEKSFVPLREAVASDDLDAAAARDALQEWLMLHRKRQTRFSEELDWKTLAKWEDFELFLEGMARQVEDSYRTDPKLHAQAASLLKDDPRFKSFAASAGQTYSNPKYGRMRAPTWFYEMGAHIGRVLDVADPTWRAAVMNNDAFLVGEVERVLAKRDETTALEQ